MLGLVLLFSFVFGHQIVEFGAVPSTRPHLPRTLAMLSPDLKQWWVGVMQRYIYIINRFYIDYVILYIDSIDSITWCSKNTTISMEQDTPQSSYTERALPKARLHREKWWINHFQPWELIIIWVSEHGLTWLMFTLNQINNHRWTMLMGQWTKRHPSVKTPYRCWIVASSSRHEIKHGNGKSTVYRWFPL